MFYKSKLPCLLVIGAVLVLVLGCANMKPELVGSVPPELLVKLVRQEGHIPYYFPGTEELHGLNDGEYVGELSGGMIDSGKVKVVIADGRITDVEILKVMLWAPDVSKENREDVFEGLPAQVIEKQSPLVDAVSGATGTTHVFKICVARALWEASGKTDPMAMYSPY